MLLQKNFIFSLARSYLLDSSLFQIFRFFSQGRFDSWLLLRRCPLKIEKYPLPKPEQQAFASIWPHHTYKNSFLASKRWIKYILINQILNLTFTKQFGIFFLMSFEEFLRSLRRHFIHNVICFPIIFLSLFITFFQCFFSLFFFFYFVSFALSRTKKPPKFHYVHLLTYLR